MQSIAVIICAHTMERWHTLLEAVASVKQQTQPPAEIIVVVDHNDHLLQMVHDQITGVRAIGNTEQKGLSGARNSGIMATHCEVVAFLDDDAIATPQWLKTLCAQYSESHVAGTGGSIIPLWPDTRPPWFPEEFYWVVGCTYRGMPCTNATIRNPIGANMSLRRSIFASVGGFRSGIGRVGSLPVGCEETELCIRTRKHYPQDYFLYLPAALVFHRVTDARATWRYFFSRCYAEGLSKALVNYCSGNTHSLSVERSYVTRVLLAGVLQGVKDACLYRDPAGMSRTAAIISGLALTSVGYIIGSFSIKYKKSRQYDELRAALFQYPTGFQYPTN